MVFLAKGFFTLGHRMKNANGEVIEETPPQFRTDPEGGSVAVGIMDDETMEPIGQAELFGDYMPWQYLMYALKLLNPKRRGNIPDFEKMVKQQHTKVNGSNCCIFSDYCDGQNCQRCIIREWMDEAEEERANSLAE